MNIIIVLSHGGYQADLELAAKVPGIDLIVGGHSHVMLGDFSSLGMKSDGNYPTRVNGPEGRPVYIVHAWEWAKMIGLLDLEFDSSGNVAHCAGQPVLMVGDTFRRKDQSGRKVEVAPEVRAEIIKTIEADFMITAPGEDRQALAKLAEYHAGVEELKKQVIASVPDDLLHVREPGVHKASGRDLSEGSLIAPVVAESMLGKVNRHGLKVHLALQNAGGVRTDIMRGDLTVATAYELLPFANNMVVLEITGAEIKKALDQGVSRGGGAFPYVAGARYTADMTRSEGERITRLEIKNPAGQWVPVEPQTVYRLVTNSFLAGGGDAYTVLKQTGGYRYDTGFSDTESFMEFAAEKGSLSRPAGTGVTLLR